MEERSKEVAQFWEDLRIDPVELAVGTRSGYTLRAYRMSDTLPNWKGNLSDPPVSDDPESTDNPDPDEMDFDANDAEPEEVPVMLARKGKLLVFEDPEDLVKYVRENDDSELAWLEEYGKLQEDLEASHVEADEADVYDLSSIVPDLRQGTWNHEELIAAGEIARDVAYVCDLEGVSDALDPGSPLDQLDNHLRDSVEGGLKAVRANRKIKKASTEQTAIAWRSVVGKMGEAVDWR
ncbi:hypothetical protein [Salininema proteolyticum]|uniref:DNA primase n=1 Tax=Salininema proteolyticum TaxID=1607685 RepID=A0ABV8U2M3_9ACTN